jgi:signal recognition particle receptor subunit beta
MGGWLSSFASTVNNWGIPLLPTASWLSRWMPFAATEGLTPTIIVVGLDNAGKTTLFRQLSFDPDRHRPQIGSDSDSKPTPTIGFNMDKCRVEGHDVVMWDLGGQDRCRGLWELYFRGGVDALIFVIDGTDTDRLLVARDEFKKVLQFDSVTPNGVSSAGSNSRNGVNAMGKGVGAEVLLLINKCDVTAAPSGGAGVEERQLQHCITIEELRSAWGLDEILAERTTRAASAVAAAGAKLAPCEVRRVSALRGLGVTDAVLWLFAPSHD